MFKKGGEFLLGHYKQNVHFTWIIYSVVIGDVLCRAEIRYTQRCHDITLIMCFPGLPAALDLFMQVCVLPNGQLKALIIRYSDMGNHIGVCWSV